jgi:hypothetical protein
MTAGGKTIDPVSKAPDAPRDDASRDPDQPAPAARPVAARRTDRLPASETSRLYAADWASFETWCRQTHTPTLPASAATVEAFLTSLAATHRPGTLARRLAAIADQHRRAGEIPPDNAALRRVLQIARAQAPVRPRGVALGSERLRLLATSCPGDRAGLRDRALFLLLAASGLGRTGAPPASRDPSPAKRDTATEPTAEADRTAPSDLKPMAMPRTALLTLQVEDLHFTREGLTFALAEPAGSGNAARHRQLSFLRSPAFSSCPVHALEDWLRASEARYGPVFRKVDRWGNVEHRALTPTALRQIFLRRGATVSHRGTPAAKRTR